jgi:5-methylcytosine-specific restriction enzyme A
MSRSAAAEVYRVWYTTPAWRNLRRAQLKREPLCAMCAAIGKRTPATIADHKIPHRGNEALFFSPANLASLCKLHHDTTKARAERRGRPQVAVGADGWPLAR